MHSLCYLESERCDECRSKREFNAISMALSHYIIDDDTKISHMIASYSTGLIINCGNFLTCSVEINYNNKYEFDKFLDINKRYTYHYTIDHIKKLRNDRTYCCIDGKYRRVFCFKCTKLNLFECSYPFCVAKDIKIENRMICSNHLRCESCKSKGLIVSILKNCKKCMKNLCNKCFYQYNDQQICPQCYVNMKRDDFAMFLNNVTVALYQHLTNIICDYCVGGAIQCCNGYKCYNDVIIGNRQNLESKIDINGNKIYWYLATKQAVNKGIVLQIYDNPLIIYCTECTKYKLSNCEFIGRARGGCNNMATKRNNNICLIHPVCSHCNIPTRSRRSYHQCIVKKCHKYICNQCTNRDREHNIMCPDCLAKDKKNKTWQCFNCDLKNSGQTIQCKACYMEIN